MMTPLNTIVGLVLPVFIDLVNSFVKENKIRFLVAFGICALVGAGLHFLKFGMFIGANEIAEDILIVWGLSQVTYQGVYKDSDLQDSVKGLVK